MRPVAVELLTGTALYRRVIVDKLLGAKDSVLIATANVKELYIEGGPNGKYRSILDAFDELARRGVTLKLLHAEVPSRPFRATFEKKSRLTGGGLALKICPRVHFKAVIVDGTWVYLGSANLTGAGLGAKDEHRRNFELGFVTEDYETIDRATALFEAVWSGAECAACKLRDICPDPIGPAAPRVRAKRATSGLRRSRR